MRKTATFSDCRNYRYTLQRVWNTELEICAFIGLNPSTTDETQDDPTIRRCIRFATDWGFGGLVMLNLFGFRATDPLALYDKQFETIVGPDNTNTILDWSKAAGCVVCAWGTHGDLFNRGRSIAAVLKNERVRVWHLGLTKGGQPKHPLYLRADTLRSEF